MQYEAENPGVTKAKQCKMHRKKKKKNLGFVYYFTVVAGSTIYRKDGSSLREHHILQSNHLLCICLRLEVLDQEHFST